MPSLSRFVWLLPLAIHIGYLFSTFSYMPMFIGRTYDNFGIPVSSFYIAWLSIIFLANFVFVFLHFRLPFFKNKMFAIPKRDFWLETQKNKEELIRRLRGIIEVSLFGLNIFFLAIYQSIYQANVLDAVVIFPKLILLLGFMVVPILIIFGVMIIVLKNLKLDAD